MSGGGMASMTSMPQGAMNVQHKGEQCGGYFQMALHYPRYKKLDYETMPEWKVDRLLKQYGLQVTGDVDVDQKRKFAMGTFLWSD